MVKQITKQEQLIDITLLTRYDGKLKAYIDGIFGTLSDKIGTVPAKIGEGEDEQTVSNLVDYIQKKVALVNADADKLAERVGKNETAVQTTLPAYIDNAVATEIAKIVNENNNGSIDTLNEIAAWIINPSGGALEMQNDIKFLQGADGTTHTKDSASVPGVKLYIDSLVAAKNVSAGVAEGELLLTATPDGNKVTVASTKKLRDAIALAETSVQSVTEGTSTENYVALDVTTANNAQGKKTVTITLDESALVDKIDEVYSDIRGGSTATVAGLETRVGYFTLATEAQVDALFA